MNACVADAISPSRDQSADNPRTTASAVSPPPTKAASADRSPAPSRFTINGQQMSVVIITTLIELEKYYTELEELAATALEPNIFYEPWVLLPSLKAFGAAAQFVFALVFAPEISNPNGPQILCGFFPLVRERRYKGIPISVLRLWQHRYGPLCTPLIRTEHADECLKAFFKWLADPSHPSPANCAAVDLRFIPGDGPFHTLLVDYLYRSMQQTYTDDCHVRALFRPAENAEAYLNHAFSGRRRKDMRAQARKLAEQGEIEYSELLEESDLEQCVNDFFRLEASGWKGKEGSAIISKKEDQEFFLKLAREGFRRGRLRMLSLKLNGQPIAQSFDLTSGRAVFALKIAYDEEYARFSPGVLMQIDNLQRLHNSPDYDWVDSCAVPRHFMINRLFTSRRIIQTVLVATGRKPGGLVVSVLPLLRWLNRLLRRPTPQMSDQE